MENVYRLIINKIISIIHPEHSTLHYSTVGIEEISAIGKRLEKFVGEAQPWKIPEDSVSVLLQEIHREWLAHYLATLWTVVEAHKSLVQWHIKHKPTTDFEESLIKLAINSIERTLTSLEQNNLVRLINFSLLVLDAAADLTGLSLITNIIKIRDTLDKVRQIVSSENPELTSATDAVILLESSMELMLFSALWTNSQVVALTASKRKSSLSAFKDIKIPPIEDLKAPVVERLGKIREEMLEDIGPVNERVRFHADGFWPLGLRRTETTVDPTI